MNTKFLLSSDNNNRNELLKKKIIHYYIANGDATIADLGREMDLSIPTVTKLVAELQDDGYILDFGKQETNGGRKPNIYGLNPASGYFVGVDMLKDKLNMQRSTSKATKYNSKKISHTNLKIHQPRWSNSARLLTISSFHCLSNGIRY